MFSQISRSVGRVPRVRKRKPWLGPFSTGRAWEMSGIPCKHVCAVVRFNGQNVVDFVDDQFKLPTQYLI